MIVSKIYIIAGMGTSMKSKAHASLLIVTEFIKSSEYSTIVGSDDWRRYIIADISPCRSINIL